MRALAMPPGMRIQFRYTSDWIASSISADLADPNRRSSLRGASTLIAYLDQADPQHDLEIVPCRMATLVDAVPLGRTVSLTLAVAEFAFASDVVGLNGEVRSIGEDLVPRREAGGIRGSYWFELPGELQTVARSSDIGTWELVIEQIASRQDFADERFFYTVEALVDVDRGEALAAKENAYQLRPSREYELRIYHFHPAVGDPNAVLGLDASHSSVAFVTNPQVLLDSRYDLKRIRLRTSSPVSADRGVLTMRRRSPNQTEWDWEFDLPVEVRAIFWRKLGLGLLLGAFLSVSPIVAAYSNPNLSSHSQLVITLVAAVSSCLVGIGAAFGLRRTV